MERSERLRRYCNVKYIITFFVCVITTICFLDYRQYKNFQQKLQSTKYHMEFAKPRAKVDECRIAETFKALEEIKTKKDLKNPVITGVYVYYTQSPFLPITISYMQISWLSTSYVPYNILLKERGTNSSKIFQTDHGAVGALNRFRQHDSFQFYEMFPFGNEEVEKIYHITKPMPQYPVQPKSKENGEWIMTHAKNGSLTCGFCDDNGNLISNEVLVQYWGTVNRNKTEKEN